jgi:ABC-type antimicrobial peptide transport system permease subunit
MSELTSDPLARGAIALLLVTALVGLALAGVGLLLTVVGDLRDERGLLQDLEAQGATPAELRRHVLLRAAAVGVLGLAGGIAAGAIVGALVVAVVSVTAGAENALPPLALAFDWKLILLVLSALVAYSAAGATGTTRRLR